MGAKILRSLRKALVAVALLAVVIAAAPQLASWVINLRRPIIARHLPANADRADKEFDRRIKARFPLGSSAAAMERDLFGAGFGTARSDKSRRYVRLDCSTGLLEESFVVVWEAQNDSLIAVSGMYYLTGP